LPRRTVIPSGTAASIETHQPDSSGRRVHPALVGLARLLARQSAREALLELADAGASEGGNNTEPRTSP
jgi:hypothetical protein